jgi:hypothetical protein
MALKLALPVAVSILLCATVAVAQKSDAKPPPPARQPTISPDIVQDLREADGVLPKRSRRLLVLELSRLERLLAATPKKAPERPRLIRRLAEGYAELAALAAHERAVAEERLRREERE